MPGTILERYELDQVAIAFDQAMRGYPEAVDLGEVFMLGGVQPVGKQLLYITTAVLARWQADTMHHDQVDIRIVRTLLKVGRRQNIDVLQPAVMFYFQFVVHC